MLNLNKVTLLCVETRFPKMGIQAIEHSTRKIKFAKNILITNLEIQSDYSNKIEFVKAPIIKNINDYSDYLLSDISNIIQGSHVLIVQWDGFVLNPCCWDPVFLEYDYIGAPWISRKSKVVGNGGFCLRSVKLIKALQNDDIIKGHPEDRYICIVNKEILEKKYGIKFAPSVLAEKFSIERQSWSRSFGFHGFFNFANIFNDREMEKIINEIPQNYLGGRDTYDLINDLIHKKKIKNAQALLDKSTPRTSRKGKLKRSHFKYWFILILLSIFSKK
ncbi:MAG: DUF5672 family protein [Coxiellaceae bacterium]|nr:DUF5672 family protein [Coxiellaceae bacterium]